ncbi:unnamed protein product [Blepharisma stoltei]|uniref:TmcB/TmcC TPR repeats domain-containing protein n=1 Tax=Blepharisma stoltei TaxID=1481888 RepID=A0AAU9IH86_9CILI|nr:unnamed protein product [Blepharisma stoltei]
MDNSLAISLLAFILGPLLAIFIIQFSLKFQRKVSNYILKILLGINSQYELEKSIRHALCSNDTKHKDEIIQIFENFYIEKKLDGNKLQAIWAANYCLFTLQDESLAKIKLNKTKNIFDFSLEANYQEYLCKKNISNACSSQSSQFSDYFLQFHIIKKADKQLCINLFKFWNEITLAKPSLKKLKTDLNSINKSISNLNTKYSQICIKFPNSKESLVLLASYYKQIIYDIEKSRQIEVKLKVLEKSISNTQNNSTIFSFSHHLNGILIISNEKNNFGEIIHCNQRLSEIFRLPKNRIIY